MAIRWGVDAEGEKVAQDSYFEWGENLGEREIIIDNRGARIERTVLDQDRGRLHGANTSSVHYELMVRAGGRMG